MRDTRTRRFALWAATAAWAATIFFASSIPAGDLPPGRYGTIGHLIGYAVLGFLAFLALRVDQPSRKAAILAVLLASFYGVTDEFHQSFVPGRTPSVYDWVIDTAGAALGVATALAAQRFVRLKR
jgi:VanZ family protein